LVVVVVPSFWVSTVVEGNTLLFADDLFNVHGLGYSHLSGDVRYGHSISHANIGTIYVNRFLY